MGARGVLRTGQNGAIFFHCPGCDQTHGIQVGQGSGARWGFNENYDRPTFTPSVLVRWNEPSDVPEEFDDTSKDKQLVCHSFVTDGRIKFLGDCTHALAGQTVDLTPKAET